MASSSVDYDAEGSGDAWQQSGLHVPGLLPETLDTDGVVIARLGGLHIVESDESVRGHDRRTVLRVTEDREPGRPSRVRGGWYRTARMRRTTSLLMSMPKANAIC
jgi:hypothetical protein